jgi:hypothetical protein
MSKQATQEEAYPNMTISAEWDILSEIRTTIHQNMGSTSIQFQHIKGHADKHQPYAKLTLMQQLNVDADRLANEYIIQNQNKAYNIVPILPTSGIQLHMEEGTVTYQLKKTIMQARSKANHQLYLCHKNNWNQADFMNIDWESHRRALNKLQAH